MQTRVFEMCEKMFKEKDLLQAMSEQIQSLEGVVDSSDCSERKAKLPALTHRKDIRNTSYHKDDLTDGQAFLASIKERLPDALRERIIKKSNRGRKPLPSLRKNTAHLLKVKHVR